MTKKWGEPVKQQDGSIWQYWMTRKFAFVPMYMQGQLIWLQFYWLTWPVDQTGKVITLYRQPYPYDPSYGVPA